MTPHGTNGIDRLLADPDLIARLRSSRVGLLSSQACRTTTNQTAAAALQEALASRADRGLVRLFAAEHGWSTTAKPGAAIADANDPQTGLPVHSVYGIRQQPDPTAYADLDAIVIDLRDLGVRCYTYATTAARFLAALSDRGPELIVCDRPNPLGAGQAGPRLEPKLRNFLAYFDGQFVHGQTLAELLVDFNRRRGPMACNLSVIPAGPPVSTPQWQPPSPSLTHPDTVPLYPGLVLLEGTNLSEGRGTDLSFRCVLAPWLDPAAIMDSAADWPVDGLDVTPVSATPTHGKFRGQLCHGIAFRITDPSRVDGLALGVHLVATLCRDPQFQWIPGKITPLALPWQDGVSEAQQAGPFIDYLMGSRDLRTALADGGAPADILATWKRTAEG